MNKLLLAMNLAYNTGLKAKARYEVVRQGDPGILPPPCDAVRLWHQMATAWLLQSDNRFWTGILDPDYPPGLLTLKDPPFILFGEGEKNLMKKRSVAMVGSRNATRTGLGNAEGFAQAFSEAGWVVVSGLAEGIDGAAHAGALNRSGATIAVLGCGPDEVYPKHHGGLKRQIVERGGLVLSEYPPGTAPQPGFFPRRNRIIAALSDALLVVEAAMRSGSLITARVASELGRPVGAIPGSIHSSQSKGCHDMIKKGAMLVETACDLLEEAEAMLPPGRMAVSVCKHTADPTVVRPDPDDETIELDALSEKVLQVMGHEPVHADALTTRLGMGTDEILTLLTELELLGLVLGESGDRWVRTNRVF